MAYKREIYDMYDEMLDDCYSDINAFGFTASQVLKTLDPIRYDLGLEDYLSSLHEDYLWCWECEEVLSGFACETCCGEDEEE